MNESTNIGEQAQYLTFYLSGEEYGIGILHVKEIIEYEPVTRVPSTPACIRGVINVRGNVVPVVDLAVRFGLPAAPVTSRTCIVIVELNVSGEHSLMGVVADSVSQVVELVGDDVAATPAFGVPVRTDYLIGLGKLDKGFILILDIARVLATGEIMSPATAVNVATESDVPFPGRTDSRVLA